MGRERCWCWYWHGVDALKLRLNLEDCPSWHVEGMLKGQRNLKGKCKRSNLVLVSV